MGWCCQGLAWGPGQAKSCSQNLIPLQSQEIPPSWRESSGVRAKGTNNRMERRDRKGKPVGNWPQGKPLLGSPYYWKLSKMSVRLENEGTKRAYQHSATDFMPPLTLLMCQLPLNNTSSSLNSSGVQHIKMAQMTEREDALCGLTLPAAVGTERPKRSLSV